MLNLSVKTIFQNLAQGLVMWAGWFTAIAGGGLWAQEKSPIEITSPYFDVATAGVAWCDVERLDVLALAKMLQTYRLPIYESDMKYAERIVDGLKQQGVTKVYSLIDTSMLLEGRQPLYILQTEKGRDLSLVQASLTPLIAPANLSIVKDGELLLVGTAKDLEAKQRHPTVKLQRLLKQMSQANRNNALCVAPSPTLSEALKMVMNLGVEDPEKRPLLARLVLLFAPMEGMRIEFTALHQGFNAVVDFDSSKKADDFKNSFKSLLVQESVDPIDRLLPQLKESSAVWEFDSEKKVEEFFSGISGRMVDIANQKTTANNMKQIALALHNHHDNFSIFPPQALVSKEGKRLLSWRVLLLPFLGQAELYNKFKLDEPWDSAHNAALIKEMPECFARPGTDPTLGKTPYVAPLRKESAFGRPGLPPNFRDIHDGTSNTLWLLEVPAEFEVVWTKPADWEVKGVEAIDLLRRTKPELVVSFLDGSVQTLPATLASEMIMKMLTIDGGEVTEFK